MLKRNFLLFLILIAKSGYSAVTLYELYPNIHTVGIMVVFDTAVPESAITEVYYEEFQNGNWSAVKQGLELSRVTSLQYAGCLFWTEPNTQYRVRTILTDSSNVIMDLTQTITTRNEPEHKTPLRIFYVSPNGVGISQDINAPGSLNQSLLDSLIAGDKVILLSGTYFIGELEIKSSGTFQNPIVFEGSSGVIIDGSVPNYIQWTRVSTDTANRDYTMFYANLGNLNTNCVIVDEERLYPYRNRMELSLFQTIRAIDGSGNIYGNYSIGLSGFFRDGRNPSGNYAPFVSYSPNTYVKFANGSDTTGKSIKVSAQSYCFNASGKSNIQIRNIEFNYFGAAGLGNIRSALYFQDCDSLLIDSCRLRFCDRGMIFQGDSDDNIIQHSSFEDDHGDWSYFQFKETNEDYNPIYPLNPFNINYFYPNFFPYKLRYLETGKIYFDRGYTGRGNIVRYNIFDGGCDGLDCPPEPGDSTTSRHFDIYENIFRNGSDDAFQVDGNASNIRVWGNVIYNTLTGISVASPCYGPVYIFRNVIYDLKRFSFDYINWYPTGYQLITSPTTGFPLKLNAAYCDIPGTVYFMHNTCDVGPDGKGFYIQQPQAQSSWANVISRNNIFHVESNEHSLWVRGTDKVDLDYNNYYCTQTFSARQDRNVYGVYNSLTDVSQHILGDLNDSTSFIETHGYQLDPSTGWRNEANHDYRLIPSSNMLDKGIPIPGVNDAYSETAPDLGAFELVVIRDTTFITKVIESADTTFSRDTVEIIQSGITDTIIAPTSFVECDSLLIRGIILLTTDSLFTDTLFITENFTQTNMLQISCAETIVDSIFIPDIGIAITEEPENNFVIIYPNPNNGTFKVSLTDKEHINQTEMILFDLLGAPVDCVAERINGNIFIRCNQNISSGIYQLHIADEKSSTRNLVVVVR